MITKKEKKPNQREKNSIIISRILNSSPANVFKAWTESKQVMRWFSPRNFSTPYCKIDPRVGGTFTLCMRSPQGKDYWSKGTYREIIEPKRLTYTDSFCDENGNIVPPERYGLNDWPDETQITINFTDYAGRTKLILQHSPIGQGKEREMCEQGWKQCLDKLADYLRKEQI